ncbi:MAG: hypothetical protein FJY56_01415 [Betaproteobacteria bacterium]|nr:hypothetical protein [Betaproteobacteria bacterium]
MTFTRTLFALPALTLALPALAHHPMGGVTPGTWTEGLLSGFGHPIIGVDHLLFIIAVGVAAYYFGQRALMIVALLAGALIGTLVHVQWPALPYHDALVALSLIILGVLLVRRDAFLRQPMAALLFAASGLAHGYAYGEAIVGAEATPLVAYLAGFTLIQIAMAASAYFAARYFAAGATRIDALRSTGGVLATVGAGFLIVALLPQG